MLPDPWGVRLASSTPGWSCRTPVGLAVRRLPGALRQNEQHPVGKAVDRRDYRHAPLGRGDQIGSQVLSDSRLRDTTKRSRQSQHLSHRYRLVYRGSRHGVAGYVRGIVSSSLVHPHNRHRRRVYQDRLRVDGAVQFVRLLHALRPWVADPLPIACPPSVPRSRRQRYASPNGFPETWYVLLTPEPRDTRSAAERARSPLLDCDAIALP